MKNDIYLLSHLITFLCIISYIILPYYLETKHHNFDKANMRVLCIKSSAFVALMIFIVSYLVNWSDILEIIAIGTAICMLVQSIPLMPYLNYTTSVKTPKNYLFLNCFASYSLIILQKNLLPENKIEISLFFLLFLNLCSIIDSIANYHKPTFFKK